MAPTLTASTALAPPPTPTFSSAPLQPVTVLNLARDAESWASVSAELAAANLSYARLKTIAARAPGARRAALFVRLPNFASSLGLCHTRS